MDATTVTVDLAKDVFELALANRAHRIVDRKRLTRRQFDTFVDGLAMGTTVVMEACGTAPYWGRRCQARGLEVRLRPTQSVRPYVRRNKTDRPDAEALLEAHRCGGIAAGPVKSGEQQALQAWHRVRTQWHAARTARIHGIRGLLREQGYALPVGARTVLTRVVALLDEPATRLPAILQQTLRALVDEVHQLETRVATIDRELARIAREDATAARLYHVPGVGVVTAPALVGAVPQIHAFHRGRDFASWLGLTPRESTSGTRRHLGRISKRGDGYLRCLLTHGARAVRLAAQRTARATPHRVTRLQPWAIELAARRGHHKAAIALANTLARIIWAVWHRDADVHSPLAHAAEEAHHTRRDVQRDPMIMA